MLSYTIIPKISRVVYVVSGNLPIPEALSLRGEDAHLACKVL